MTPMQLGTQAELDILGLAVTAGAAMGLIYGLFQIVARRLNFAAVRLICDLTYTLMFGAVYFVFTLAQTNYLRGFVLLGMIGGAAGWHFAIGRFAVRGAAAVFGAAAKPAVRSMHKISAKSRRMFVKKYPNSEKSKKVQKST